MAGRETAEVSISEPRGIMHRVLLSLYTGLYRGVLVLLLPACLLRAIRASARIRLASRLGFYPAELRKRLALKQAPRVWIHAVSAGEVLVAFEVIRALRSQSPELEVILSTTTVDGRTVAGSSDLARNLIALIDCPFDLPGVIQRSLIAIQPDLLLLVELELWPNLLDSARRLGLPVAVVNARLPHKEARGYGRLKPLFRPLIQNLKLVAAQSETDAERFAVLGVSQDRLSVTGNVKFDSLFTKGRTPPHTSDFLASLRSAGRHPVIVAGSTHPGEEEILLSQSRRLRSKYPNLLLVLVPRHIGRASELLSLARQDGGTAMLRSEAKGRSFQSVDTLVVDSMGELRFLYPLATVIFVGKSLSGRGGQNVIEAAASGNPVVWGPYMGNFQEVADAFLREEAAVQVATAEELEEAIDALLADWPRRAGMGSRAQEVVARNQGATCRTAELCARLLPTDARLRIRRAEQGNQSCSQVLESGHRSLLKQGQRS